jgi:trehalose utilization protein
MGKQRHWTLFFTEDGAVFNSILRGLPDEWRMSDEWYSFKTDPWNDGSHILVTLDESTYPPRRGSMDLHMGDHPIAWTRQIGKGRMFYSAIGHRPESYTEAHARRLLMQGIVSNGTGQRGVPVQLRPESPICPQKSACGRCSSLLPRIAVGSRANWKLWRSEQPAWERIYEIASRLRLGSD